jgi:CarD family transcriptional regulator
MFVVGDKIVYPMHGAGTIVSIEEKEVLGVIKKYLIMKMPIGDIKISIPVDRTEDIGIRDVMSADQRDKLMNVFQEEGTEMPGNWNQRYRHNLELLKTGDAVEIARVVRDLMLLEEE